MKKPRKTLEQELEEVKLRLKIELECLEKTKKMIEEQNKRLGIN